MLSLGPIGPQAALGYEDFHFIPVRARRSATQGNVSLDARAEQFPEAIPADGRIAHAGQIALVRDGQSLLPIAQAVMGLVAVGCHRAEEFLPRAGHRRPALHQRPIPRIHQFPARALLAHALEALIALPQSPPVTHQVRQVTGTNLGDRLIEEAAPAAGGSLHQTQILGPEHDNRNLTDDLGHPSSRDTVDLKGLP